MQTSILAILAAGVAGWLFGAAWYTALGRTWQAALGMNADACKERKMPLWPMLVSLLAALVMAAVLHQLLLGMGMLGVMSTLAGALAGFTVGVGFMLTATLVNNMFLGRNLTVIVIDGVHWVMVATIQGAVIAALT